MSGNPGNLDVDAIASRPDAGTVLSMVATTADTETQPTDEGIPARKNLIYNLAYTRDDTLHDVVYTEDALVFVIMKRLGMNFSNAGETFTVLRKGQK